MNWLGVVLVASCAIAFVSCQGELVVPPISQGVITGETVEFACTGFPDNETLHPYTWLYSAMNDYPTVIVYDCQVNPAYAPYYEAVETEDGGCNLRVIRANAQSAGTYTCQHWHEQGSAQLVVLYANSQCDFGPFDLISGDFMEIRCYLNFNGSVPPHMNFRSESGSIYNNATINTFPNQVNGRVQFPVYPPTTRAVTANTFFDPPITFSFTWTLPTINVQYPVTPAQVSLESDFECNYFANYTRLTCSATGFPEPTISWTDVNAGVVYPTSTITLTEPGENHFICTAENVIRGEKYTQQRSIALNVSGDEPSTCGPDGSTPEPTSPPTTTEPTTTTTTPEPTTTTTEIPVTECGSILRVAPPDVNLPSGWNLMCFINRTDADYLNTQCRDLIQRLPPDIGDYQSLLGRGGNFGCALNTRQDFIGVDGACFNNYQQTITLGSFPTATKLAVCIRLPATH